MEHGVDSSGKYNRILKGDTCFLSLNNGSETASHEIQ